MKRVICRLFFCLLISSYVKGTRVSVHDVFQLRAQKHSFRVIAPAEDAGLSIMQNETLAERVERQ